jgi:hypothetical protein
MSDFKNAANGSFGGRKPSQVQTNDASVNQALKLLEDEGFEFREAILDEPMQLILLTNDKTQEAAIIAMSTHRYPYISESGFYLAQPEIYRGPKDDTDMPVPTSVRTYIRKRTAPGGNGPSAGPSPV